MKTTSYKELCNNEGLEFVEIIKSSRVLEESEYFALMVIDSSHPDSPHIQGVDINTHQNLVGIERPSGNRGCFLSKNFNRRRDYLRGETIIVKTDSEDSFIMLDY